MYINQINVLINLLPDYTAKLSGILLKIKVLAFKIKHKSSINWSNNELNGYGNNKRPDYRILSAFIRGSVE